MKMYGGVDVQIHDFFTSALVGGKCSVSRPVRFIPGKELVVNTGKEDGEAQEPVWTARRRNILEISGTGTLTPL
jgi:hypothetical protein